MSDTVTLSPKYQVVIPRGVRQRAGLKPGQFVDVRILKTEAHDLHAKFAEFFLAGKVVAALCHGVAVLRYAKGADGTPLVQGRTVTGFANVEEDFADEAVWQYGMLPRGQHIMPWRIEDEMRALGANYVRAGLWRSFAVRDGNLVTGQQNFSGMETAGEVVKALGV